MVISSLSELPQAIERAVIINVNTTQVATLALVSAIRYAQVPVLVVDCQPEAGSFHWFVDLQRRYPFDILQAPLRKHGETLDAIFMDIPAERVLLVDSDVELLNATLVERMRRAVESAPNVFGSGYLHPAQWLHFHYDTSDPINDGIGYYVARPWIPFTLLRVSHARIALKAGRSFMHRLVRNDIPALPLLSRLLWRRFKYARLRNLRLGFLDPLRRTFDGYKPAYVHYDTGAEVYEYLISQGLGFVPLSDAGELPWLVRHLGGATRSGLHGESHDAFPAGSAAAFAVERLGSEYGISMPEAFVSR